MKTFIKLMEELDQIDEMANLTNRDHNLGDVKLNVRQPGDKRYSHDVSVKIFKNDLNSGAVVRVDRNTNKVELKIAPKKGSGVNRKILTSAIEFIENNIENFVSLWDDQSKAIDDFEWS